MATKIEITEKDLLDLKRKAEEGKKKLIEAETMLREVTNNIQIYREELIAKGVDPDNADESISEKAAEINTLYNKILEAFPN